MQYRQQQSVQSGQGESGFWAAAVDPEHPVTVKPVQDGVQQRALADPRTAFDNQCPTAPLTPAGGQGDQVFDLRTPAVCAGGRGHQYVCHVTHVTET